MLYLYGIIRAEHQPEFTEKGLAKAEVHSLVAAGLKAVYSEIDLAGKNTVVGSRRNMIAHQRVVENIMVHTSVVPFSFGTVVETEQALQELIHLKADTFAEALQFVDGKIELGLKVFWNDMPQIYQEVTTENQKIARIKEQVAKGGNKAALIEVGKLVEESLAAKKSAEGAAILEQLIGAAIDYQVGKNINESMLLNASFFVEKSQEKAFDALVGQVADQIGERASFKYVGPLAPYSFLKLNLSLQGQE